MKAFGKDYLTRSDGQLTIESPHNYPTFEPRNYRKWQITFEGHPYYVSHKSQHGSRFHYTLKAWQPHDTEIPAGVVAYDENFSLDYASGMKRVRAGKTAGFLLVFTLPLFGFLWSGFKHRVEEKTGLNVYNATGQSFQVEAALLVVVLVLYAIINFTGMQGAAFLGINTKYLFWAVLILVPDLLYRYDGLNREEKPLFGFYEWLFDIFFKKAKT